MPEQHTSRTVRAAHVLHPATRWSNPEADSSLSHPLARKYVLLLIAIASCILASGCRERRTEPYVEFTKIPLTDPGGTPELDTIEGRVVGAPPGHRIVLFARSGAWYVQPFADQPFTEIKPDSTFSNSTHLGTEFAALVVEAGYLPPASSYVLPTPGEGV
ncbi:MAG TPA: hypothetical protein VG778_08325, partial [Blastocatellia bacterium]|nr:hypothetical protein [Blastocatellia bacterium]